MALSHDEAAEIEDFISTVSQIRGRLRGWDRTFFDGIEKDYDEQGAALYISHRMWKQIERIKGLA